MTLRHPRCARHTLFKTDNDAASDVGSMISVQERVAPITAPTATQQNTSPAAARGNGPQPLPLQAVLGAAGLEHHKRGKRDPSGEGSQSEGFDSPM